MHAFIDLAEVSSFGRLRRRTPLNTSCLEIAGLDGIRSCAPMLFLAVWFQRDIIGRVLRSMVKSEAENDMVAVSLRTNGLATMVRVFVVIRNLLGDS
jgi:hypothetical protein